MVAWHYCLIWCLFLHCIIHFIIVCFLFGYNTTCDIIGLTCSAVCCCLFTSIVFCMIIAIFVIFYFFLSSSFFEDNYCLAWQYVFSCPSQFTVLYVYSCHVVLLIIIFSKTKGAIPPTTHKEQQQQTVPMVIKMARVREKLRRTGEHILPGKTIVILEANIAMIIQNTILVNKQQQTAEHVRPMISQVVL